jgi:hypothetical protein
MLRPALAAAGLMLAAITAPAAMAETTAATPAAKFTVADSTIGALLDDPGAKAVLMKYIPSLAGSAQIDMARGLTLKQIQSYAADTVTDQVLQQIDYDLAKLK